MITENVDQKRLFISIPLTEKWEVISNSIKELNVGLKDVRWTRPENLHLTLLFIGDTPDIYIDAISEQIAMIAAKQPSFKLIFDKVSVAPNAKRPSMIWSLFTKNQDFTELSKILSKEISKVYNFPTDNREPVPHLTLARFRELLSNDQLTIPKNNIFHDLEVLKIDLMSSELTPEGPVHKFIKSYPLLGV